MTGRTEASRSGRKVVTACRCTGARWTTTVHPVFAQTLLSGDGRSQSRPRRPRTKPADKPGADQARAATPSPISNICWAQLRFIRIPCWR